MTKVTASATDRVARAVSVLFVPGDRPERFSKAQNSGADVTILDLEDAVSAQNKHAALQFVVAALTPRPGVQLVTALVRLSGAEASDELSALLALATVPGNGLLGVMVPKTESASQIAAVVKMFPPTLACIALIESAIGLVNALEIARVSGVTRLSFGAVDFGLNIDASHESVFDYARAQLVICSVAAGIAPPLDSPSLNFTDLHLMAQEALRARESGCGGKLCIHPAQIAAVRASFLPTAEQVAWAHRVLQLEGGATQLDGAMIDLPVALRAQRILAVADAAAAAAGTSA